MRKATGRGRHATHSEMPGRRPFGPAMLVGLTIAVAVAVVMGGIAVGHRVAPVGGGHAPGTTSSVRTTAEAPPAPPPPPLSTPGDVSSAWAADFDAMAAGLEAKVGLVVSAVGDAQPPTVLGEWQSGPAWSTIKVPLAIAALRREDPPVVTKDMTAAITQSDNAAAEAIWQDLGEPTEAAAAVQEVLAQTGDPTIVESRRVRPEFTAFGQTWWSLTNQARFIAAAACTTPDEPITALMGRVEPDQRWGLGVIDGARFKGGWGPDPDGGYLVRQMGFVPTAVGMTAVTVAVQPASGAFGDGTQALTQVAEWLNDHLDELPSAPCGAPQ